ncbi:MAG: hypothetical protein ACLT9S_02040 [Faecalibacterium sp.]
MQRCSSTAFCNMFVVLALRACIHAEFHTASVSRHHLMLDEVFSVYSGAPYRGTDAGAAGKEFFVSREHIAREFKRQTRADGAPLYP